MMDLVNLILSGAQTVVGTAQLGLGMYQIYKEKVAANAQNFDKNINAINAENKISKEDFQNALMGIDPVCLKMILDKAVISDNDLVQKKYASLLSNSIAGKTEGKLDMFVRILDQLSPKEIHLLDVYYAAMRGKTPIVVNYLYVTKNLNIGDQVGFSEIYSYLSGFEFHIKEKDLDSFMAYNERLVSMGLFTDRRKNPELAFQAWDENEKNIRSTTNDNNTLKDHYQFLLDGKEGLSFNESYLVSTPLCNKLLQACN